MQALLGAVDSSETFTTDAHHIGQIIKALQADPRSNPDDLFRVEWAYLPVLSGHYGASPKFIERRLADNPQTFCEVVRLVFRSKKDSEQPELTTEAKGIAANGYRLLTGWKTVPGSRDDGTYDGEALRSWLDAAKRECEETGHLEIAMTMVGHVLSYAPADPTGLWIHRAVAAALNARDVGDMRDGFRVELINRRGVHGFTSGREEQELAAKYRSQAELVEEAGFHRLATTLRDLAAAYEQDAERESSRDPFAE